MTVTLDGVILPTGEYPSQIYHVQGQTYAQDIVTSFRPDIGGGMVRRNFGTSTYRHNGVILIYPQKFEDVDVKPNNGITTLAGRVIGLPARRDISKP